MRNINDSKDNIDLTKIENLSKKISDLVKNSNFEKINEINKIRTELITKFKDKNNKDFQKTIRLIKEKNFENIRSIENKFNKLKNEQSKYKKRFKAYNSN